MGLGLREVPAGAVGWLVGYGAVARQLQVPPTPLLEAAWTPVAWVGGWTALAGLAAGVAGWLGGARIAQARSRRRQAAPSG